MDSVVLYKPNDMLMPEVRDRLLQGYTVNLPLRGYSMRPFLEHERDMATLALPHRLRVGDAVLAYTTARVYVLHRIIDIQGDTITLMGDGNVRGTEQCRREDVIGIVTHYIYPHRTVAADDASLVRRIRWWRRLLPIRRYLLFVYRAVLGNRE